MQEFLAALALSWRDDDEGPESWWQIVRARLDDPQWRETLELLPACLYDEGGQRRVDQLIDRVLKLATPGDLVSEAWALGIAGGMSASMSVYAYSPRPHLATALLKLRVGVMAIFDRGRAEEVPLKVRIAAAEALGRAGDPRLAADNFISVPGTNVEMGRYPVTVGEFARFVEDDKGYLTTHWWDTRGWHWRETWGRTQPMEWDQQTKLPNRPVTYVSWWEARAYCRWLAYLLAREIRLPTAGEWETAATPQGGEYPWGTSKPDEELANFHKAVGGPTPVGLYPAGAGRYGHLDLAGNVREWCNDGPENSGDVRWLKGGSWADDGGALAVRCRMVGPCSRSDGDGGFRVVVTPASK